MFQYFPALVCHCRRQIFAENKPMHWILMAAMVTAGSLPRGSRPVERPVCSVQLHGKYWPDAANADMRAARKLAQCGALEICTDTGRRYKWKPVTVNVRQLGKTPQEPTAACAALVEEFSGATQAPIAGSR